jgi:hypothetical protein
LILVDQSVVSTLVVCTECTWSQMIEPRLTMSRTHAAGVTAGLVHVQVVHPDDAIALRNIERAADRHAAKQSA